MITSVVRGTVLLPLPRTLSHTRTVRFFPVGQFDKFPPDPGALANPLYDFLTQVCLHPGFQKIPRFVESRLDAFCFGALYGLVTFFRLLNSSV